MKPGASGLSGQESGQTKPRRAFQVAVLHGEARVFFDSLPGTVETFAVQPEHADPEDWARQDGKKIADSLNACWHMDDPEAIVRALVDAVQLAAASHRRFIEVFQPKHTRRHKKELAVFEAVLAKLPRG